jgi:thiol:disulfide interchange protein DsbC
MRIFPIILFLLGSALVADDTLISELNTLKIIQESKINILKVRDEGNVYFLKGIPTQVSDNQPKQAFDFYLTKDKKVLIMGNAIYTDTKKKLAFPIDKSIIQNQEAFSYGSGKETLYVFVDPQCPYCKQFEIKMATLKDKYTFKIYLFPLPFHADALPMSKWILKGKDKNEMSERLIAIANGSIEYKNLVLSSDEEKKLTDTLNIQINIGQGIEIQGTPTILDSEFEPVNWPTL